MTHHYSVGDVVMHDALGRMQIVARRRTQSELGATYIAEMLDGVGALLVSDARLTHAHEDVECALDLTKGTLGDMHALLESLPEDLASARYRAEWVKALETQLSYAKGLL